MRHNKQSFVCVLKWDDEFYTFIYLTGAAIILQHPFRQRRGRREVR